MHPAGPASRQTEDHVPDLSVIVPARNAAATLGRTLAALAGQRTTRSFEVLVVDDGSDDETVKIARAAGARVLQQPGLGPGQARNLGARSVESPFLAFTDADCFPDPDWIEAGCEALEAADLVQGRVLPDPTSVRRHYDHTIWVTRETGLYETANLLVRRDLYLDVGGFEDWLEVSIGKRLGEDVHFGWKVRRQGGVTAFAPSALVHHAVFPRRWHEYVLERRRLVYFPDLVREVPELRGSFLWARVFLSPRSAACAAAVAAVPAAGALWRVSPRAARTAVLGAVPWSLYLARRLTGNGRYGPKLAAVDAVADLVGFASLVYGSLRRRTPVI